MLELGVVSAEGVAQWARTIARTAVGSPAKSPFVQVTNARTVEVVLNRKVLYELDGGDREKVKKFKVKVEPGAIKVCVPTRTSMSTASRVPETWELTGDDARKALLEHRADAPVRDAFLRLRDADGFSHARSLAFVDGARARPGPDRRSSASRRRSALEVSRVIVDTIQTAMPGLAGELLTDAVRQASKVGSTAPLPAALLGLVGTRDHCDDGVRAARARLQPDLWHREGSTDRARSTGVHSSSRVSAGSSSQAHSCSSRSDAASGNEEGAVPRSGWSSAGPSGLALAGLGARGPSAVRAPAPPAELSWLAFGSRGRRALLDGRDPRLRRAVQRELVVRRNVRAARRHRRAAALVVLLGVRSSTGRRSLRSSRPCGRARPSPRSRSGGAGQPLGSGAADPQPS